MSAVTLSMMGIVLIRLCKGVVQLIQSNEQAETESFLFKYMIYLAISTLAYVQREKAYCLWLS